MKSASEAYARIARETAPPRELEATLLLTAAARLQAIDEAWTEKKPQGFDEALLYNRRLWTVLLNSVTHKDNRLPAKVRENITRLGVWIMAETYSLMTDPKPDHLKSIIRINRGIAAGLRSKV
jgi:flagellar biosynthesis activator protein FlaF